MTTTIDPASMPKISLLYVMRDPLPPTRPDVRTLFGKYLPTHGIYSDLIGPTARHPATQDGTCLEWPAGQMIATGPAGGLIGEALKALRDIKALWRLKGPYDMIQVRDRTVSAIASFMVAKLRKLPFVFWMSFPIVEGYEVRAREVGRRHGWVTWLANAVRAKLSRWVFYGFIAKRADHIFVQSDAMRDWMHALGIPKDRMTAVPMGVDMAVITDSPRKPINTPKLQGRRVIAYLGTLALAREPGFMLDVVADIRHHYPDILLLLIGDGVAPDEQAWLRKRISELDLENHVWLTGWMPQEQALDLLRQAEVGLSPIPRGPLYDVSSPTKALEYLALGIPCVGNDIPDQRYVLEKSGAGKCVPMTTHEFSGAIREFLAAPSMARELGRRGPMFIESERSYATIARAVAQTYLKLSGAKA